MKIRWMASGFVAGAALMIGGSHVLSQDHGHDAHHQDGGQEMDPAAMQDMMEMMMKMGAPGDQHELLQYFVGEWDASIEMMGSEPTKGSADCESIFDGRFIVQKFQGEMMGMPFEGVNLMGYDNYKKKFRNVWVDSMSTTIMVSEGLLDQTGTQLTFFGEMDEYLTGEHDKMVKYVYRMVDQDTLKFEIHDLGIVPGDTKVFGITYTRK